LAIKKWLGERVEKLGCKIYISRFALFFKGFARFFKHENKITAGLSDDYKLFFFDITMQKG